MAEYKSNTQKQFYFYILASERSQTHTQEKNTTLPPKSILYDYSYIILTVENAD